MLRVTTILLTLSLPFGTGHADDEGPTSADEPREYQHDYHDEDLSGRKFDGKNLDDTNFEGANLTRASFRGCSLRHCNFQGAEIDATAFHEADLTGSDFRGATLTFPELLSATFNEAIFDGCDFSKVTFSSNTFHKASFRKARGFQSFGYFTEFNEADFRGADFSKAAGGNAKFTMATYSKRTRMPVDFDPDEAGMVLAEEDEEKPESVTPAPGEKPARPTGGKPKPKPETNKPLSGEALFTKLDADEDGVLTGDEIGDYADRDADEDGEVSTAEFLAGEN